MSEVQDIIEKEPILVVGDVVQSELVLADEAVMLKYEKNLIPKDMGLYISLSYLGPGKVFASNNYLNTEVTPPTEVQEVVMHHLVQVDVLSFGPAARKRMPEIAMAIGSQAAQRAMAKYSMAFARLPTPFVDTSSLEGQKMLNRFTCEIVVSAIYRKIKTDALYYDKFPKADVTAPTIVIDPSTTGE